MFLFYSIIILAVISRFVPHMANFAPITAIAMFAAFHMDWKKAAGLTLAARLISDAFLGFFAWPLLLAVYASHLVGILFGLWLKKTGQMKWGRLAVSSAGSAVVFFLVTNFAFLYAEYPHNFSGIVQAYVNGLPFLKGTLLGDLFYSFALFGAYAFALYVRGRYVNKHLLSDRSLISAGIGRSVNYK